MITASRSHWEGSPNIPLVHKPNLQKSWICSYLAEVSGGRVLGGRPLRSGRGHRLNRFHPGGGGAALENGSLLFRGCGCSAGGRAPRRGSGWRWRQGEPRRLAAVVHHRSSEVTRPEGVFWRTHISFFVELGIVRIIMHSKEGTMEWKPLRKRWHATCLAPTPRRLHSSPSCRS